MSRYTEAKKASNKKWDSANLDRMSLALPAGSKERITIAAAAAGQSINAYIGQAINERIERDKAEQPLRLPGYFCVKMSDNVRFVGDIMVSSDIAEKGERTAKERRRDQWQTNRT